MPSLWFEALAPYLHEPQPHGDPWESSDPGLEEVKRLSKFVDHGVREFLDYLNHAKRHLEETSIAIGWRPAGNESAETEEDGGVWIELIPPPDDRGQFDRDVLEFFRGQTDRIYEARERNGSGHFRRENEITIIDFDENAHRLLLERRPGEDYLLLRPNTYTTSCQIKALNQLRYAPRQAHLPLLRLLGPAEPKKGSDPLSGRPVPPMRWPDVQPQDPQRWFILDRELEGVEEQRDFVRKALGTPDFAILEGPPGSGKTTVICELILQMLSQNKRVLLCASTHVAVDNVLERLTSGDAEWARHVLPIRIGDKRRVSQRAREYQLDTITTTLRGQIRRHLESVRKRTRAQEMMLALTKDTKALSDLLLDCANIVCGTTIGILQHPTIKAHLDACGMTPHFDMLIIDEASKTTFQEFLVPALLARRWVLVGDPRQLSPYVDDGEVAAHIRAALPDPDARNACLDVFDNARQKEDPERWKPVAVVADETVHDRYKVQAKELGIKWVEARSVTDPIEFYRAPILLATRKDLKDADQWPLDLLAIRGTEPGMDSLRCRIRGYAGIAPKSRDTDPERSWETEIAWRLIRIYEQRLFEQEDQRHDTSQRYKEDIEQLEPRFLDPLRRREVMRRLLDTQRLAMPSVLESLQNGFGRPEHVTPTTLTEGLPEDALEQRHTLLTYQRRMHPDISRFPREHIYENDALRDPRGMEKQRDWGAGPWPDLPSRAVWCHVQTKTKG